MLNNIWKNPMMWRYLTNFWTVIFYVVIVWDFTTNNSLNEILGPVAAIYISVLAIYAGEKEFERWNDLYEGRHPGEIFIFLWTLLMVGLFVANIVLDKHYKMPGEVTATYITTLGILAITRKSRSFFSNKK